MNINNGDAVTIKSRRALIIDNAWAENGWNQTLPKHKTGKKVAVVGAGPPAWRRPSNWCAPATT